MNRTRSRKAEIPRGRSWPERAEAAVHGAATLLNRCAAGLLLLLVFLTLGDVLLRKFLHQGILGTLELSEFMMAAIVFFSLAQGEILERNVHFGLVWERLPLRVRRLIRVSAPVLFAGFFGLMALTLTFQGRSLQAIGEVSADLLLPKYPFYYVAAAGCLVLALALFLKFLRALRERPLS